MNHPWVSPAKAAPLVARPAHSIWTWIRRGKITTCCELTTRKVYVHLPDLGDYARQAEQRWHDPRHAHRRRGHAA